MRGIRYRKRNSNGVNQTLQSALVLIILCSLTNVLRIEGSVLSNYSNSATASDNSKFYKTPRLAQSARNSGGGVISARTGGEVLSKLGLKATLVDDDKPHDKTFFGEDSDGHPIVIGTWFQYGSYTLAVAMFGTGFLVACAATAVYYVLFVVTDPSQSASLRSLSQDQDEGWAWGRKIGKLFTTLDLALDLYEKLDLREEDCQKKLMCEIRGGRYLDKFGNAFLQRISNSWKSKVSQGNSRRSNSKVSTNFQAEDQNQNQTESKSEESGILQNCSKYSKCGFSINEFQNKLISLY